MLSFDSLVRAKLREILQNRVIDGALLRLIAKCLHVGILDGEKFTKPDEGTVQGSALSPLLGNVYLHHVLDQWFESEVRPKLTGHARLIRYRDDFVIGFAKRGDAQKVPRWLHDRMSVYGLTLHPEKTRLIPFRRPRPNDKDGSGRGAGHEPGPYRDPSRVVEQEELEFGDEDQADVQGAEGRSSRGPPACEWVCLAGERYTYNADVLGFLI